MQSILAVTPVPAAMMALGCIAGITATRYAHERAPVTPPSSDRTITSAQVAIADGTDAWKGSNEGKTIDRSPDGLFYVTARVNGRAVRFLVDTGANVMVLRAKDAAAVGAAPTSPGTDSRVETASGSAPMAWTKLREVRLAGHRLHGVRAAVVRDGLGVSLLGQNLLSQLGPVRIEKNRMDLG